MKKSITILNVMALLVLAFLLVYILISLDKTFKVGTLRIKRTLPYTQYEILTPEGWRDYKGDNKYYEENTKFSY